MAKFYRRPYTEKHEANLRGEKITIHFRIPQSSELLDMLGVFTRLHEREGEDIPLRGKDIADIVSLLVPLIEDLEGVEDEDGPLDYRSLSLADAKRLVGEIDVQDLVRLQFIVQTIGRLPPEQKKSSSPQSKPRSEKSASAPRVKQK